MRTKLWHRTKGDVSETCTRKAAVMPQLFTTLLTKAAVAVLEALAMRLLTHVWNNFAHRGHPMAAAA